MELRTCARGLVLGVMAVVGFDAAASIRTEAIVKVFSDGKLMATYEAIDTGRMDGDCLVFHIRKGAREPEVRVCGTFVVESVR